MCHLPWILFDTRTKTTSRSICRLSSLASAAILAILVSGCPENAPTGDNTLRGIDLVVGDIGGSDNYDSKLLIYKDILLGGSQQNPDVTITNQSFGRLMHPHSIQLTGDFTGNDLYVADLESSVVAIWRDYRNLIGKSGPYLAPSVVLDYASSGICNPVQILHADNRLYVCGEHTDCSTVDSQGTGTGLGRVAVFAHIGAVTTGHGDTPSLVLDDVEIPRCIEVYNDTLYVSTHYNNGTIGVYENMTARVNGTFFGDPTVPTAVLGRASFSLTPSYQLLTIKVAEGRLYVGGGQGIYVFDNADSLIDDQAPSAFLGNALFNVQASDMAIVGKFVYSGAATPWTPSQYYKSTSGLVAESSAATTESSPAESMSIDSIFDFDKSVIQFDAAFRFANEHQVLFACFGGQSGGSAPGLVGVYLDARLPLEEESYTFALTPLKDIVRPNSLDSNRFYSTTSTN